MIQSFRAYRACKQDAYRITKMCMEGTDNISKGKKAKWSKVVALSHDLLEDQKVHHDELAKIQRDPHDLLDG